MTCRRRALHICQHQGCARREESARTELALRERLEQADEALLARVEDLARLGDVDRAHLERAERVVGEEVVDVRPRELHGRRRVVVERDAGQRLQPVLEQLGHARHVHAARGSAWMRAGGGGRRTRAARTS
jgi:hypothetical protein